MKNIKVRNFVYIIVGVSALAWLLLSWFSKANLSGVVDFIKLIPGVVTVDSIVIFCFTKWFWKIPLLRGWLVPFPNLNGTWTGLIYSDWVNPETKAKVPPIPVSLKVRQNFFSFSCLMQTSEMDSHSYVEGFYISEERQIKRLCYSYQSSPRISLANRSQAHDGSVVFDILEGKVTELVGRYWTERKTTGEIRLKFKCRAIEDGLPSELAPHPVTESENRR